MIEPVELRHAGVRCAAALELGEDLVGAASRASQRAVTELRGRVPDLAMVFVADGAGAPDDDAARADAVALALETAASQTGAGTTLGCLASSGVLADGRGVQDQSGVTVWVASLPGVSLRSFHLEVIRTPETIAVVGMPPSHEDDRIGLVLADAWSFPIEGFVDHSAAAYPGLVLAGAVAGGRAGAGSTRLLVDGRVVARGAVGVMISGDVEVLTAVSQGCRPVGPVMTVTGVDGNLLTSLAGSPAAERLAAVIDGLEPGDQALATRGLHVGVARDEYVTEPEQGDYLVRGLLGVDRDSGVVAVGDALEVGQTVRFQIRDCDAASEDLVTTLGRLRRDAAAARAAGALVFSCNGRGTGLFSSADHDAQTVGHAFPDLPVAGLFAGGEIGPVAGRNHLHAFSASVVVLCAAPDADVG
jgi:small ligand-binding sensory domain FIST